MTVRKLREIIDSLFEDDLDCAVVMPMHTEIRGMYAFEEVCPAVTEMITIGPSPDFIPDSRKENGDQEVRAFLIAPHSFHEDDDETNEAEKQKALN